MCFFTLCVRIISCNIIIVFASIHFKKSSAGTYNIQNGTTIVLSPLLLVLYYLLPSLLFYHTAYESYFSGWSSHSNVHFNDMSNRYDIMHSGTTVLVFYTIRLLVCCFSTCIGAVVPVPVQVVPRGIESVNGSDVNMGCTSPLVDSGGVMVCNSTDGNSSYLLDDNSPAINTSTSDWASQLVDLTQLCLRLQLSWICSAVLSGTLVLHLLLCTLMKKIAWCSNLPLLL